MARSADGFTNLFDVAELTDGRVLMTDNRERAVVLVDLAAGTVERLGRQGEGPEEHRSATTILPQPDGSFHVYDSANRRFLVVSAGGEIVGTARLKRPALTGFSAPRGPDAAGAFYIAQRRVGDGGLLPEATLYRWMHESGDLEVVGTLSNYAPGQEGRGFVPMPREDAWSFLPDGSVAIVVAEDYHVEWYARGGGTVTGPPVPHPRVRVGEREREAWLDEIYSRPPGGGVSVNGGGSGGGDRRVNRRPVDPDRFPRFVPPFKRGYAPAAPWGEIWLELEVISDDEQTVFDVLGRDGTLIRRVSAEGRARLLGFGPDAIYVARKDDFDLEWLEKYERPSL